MVAEKVISHDYDTPGDTYITGVWIGADAAYEGESLPVPSQFNEAVRRKADHFDALVAILGEAAQTMGLSPRDDRLWLPRAGSALEKARAIPAGAPDPDSSAVDVGLIATAAQASETKNQ
jgi:hypothetical protein